MTGIAAPARTPVVVGLWPRVGAGTVAAALHADEADPGSMAADVAVCGGDDASLRRAAALCGASVLLVVLVGQDPPPSRARQRELGRSHAAVAVLPHVPHWAGLVGVPGEAAAVLARRPEQLPPVLRAYAEALRQAVNMLLRGGGLGLPRPPALRWSPRDATRPFPAPASTPTDRSARGRITLGAPLGETEPYGRPLVPPISRSAHARTPTPATDAPVDDAPFDDAPGHALDDHALDDDALEAATLAVSPSATRAATAPRPSTTRVR